MSGEVLVDLNAVATARKAVFRDFELFAAKCLKIRTKSGDIKPFILNEGQKELLRVLTKQLKQHGYVRIVVLKGRQMGISTFIGAFLYWLTSTRAGRRTIVVAHKTDSTSTLFNMTKRFHQLAPSWIKPHTAGNNRRELDFDLIQSSYLVTTAGGDEIGRSETLQNGHMSETAFWPKATAEANFTALMQAIPVAGSEEARGSVVFSESTANGVSGVFYTQWKQAEAGMSEWWPVFLSWTLMPEYVADVPADYKPTAKEEDLIARYGLSPGQIMFRRLKVANNGEDKFKQEYPLCAEEAFLTTGSPVFSPNKVQYIISRDENLEFELLAFTGEKFIPSNRGDLLVWDKPEKGGKYFIGADVGGGIPGRDYSVAVVMDDRRRVVALYRGYPDPEQYASILQRLGLWYNEAHLIVENNNHGILPCSILGRELNYPSLYTEEVINTLDGSFRTRIGWNTNPKTKPLIIDELRTSIMDESIHIPTKLITRELMTFVVDAQGRMAAEMGKDENGEPIHDDCVMALALANHIVEERFDPIEVTDDFYIGDVNDGPQRDFQYI